DWMTNIAFSLAPTVTVVRALMMRSSITRPDWTRPMRRTFGPTACAIARITAVICPGRPPGAAPGPAFIAMIVFARFRKVLGRESGRTRTMFPENEPTHGTARPIVHRAEAHGLGVCRWWG